MSTAHPRERYTNVVHEAEIDGGWSGHLRIVRGRGNNDQELVFVDSDLLGPMRLVLTREQAADFAEAVHNASGLQTSTYGAQFLAETVRQSLTRKGISPTRAAAATGIPRRRLSKLMAGEIPMTTDELKALSAVESTLK
jgi:predicted XRE-type DNA-binding protein